MIEVIPSGKIETSLTIPGSKYVANRALPIAALADGDSTLKNMPSNADIKAAKEALESLGVCIEQAGTDWSVHGTNGQIQGNVNIDVGESGTLLRFITALSVLADGDVTITGSKRIRERPIGILTEALKGLGAGISCTDGKPPITKSGGWLRGGTAQLDGSVSSQFVSALLLVAPFAGQDTHIIIEEELVSKQYVDMTIQLMEAFGVRVLRQGYRQFTVKAGQRYRAKSAIIPGDWSSANYFFAAAAITNGTITVKGLDTRLLQGEALFLKVLEDMGCEVTRKPGMITVCGPERLRGVEVNMSAMPDAVQTLVATAIFADSKTQIVGIEHLVHKESDRIGDTITELSKLGIKARKIEGGMQITPGKPKPGTVDPHNDHRMAMSLALLGLKEEGITIDKPECAGKSFPQFWDTLREIGVELRES